VVSGSAVNQLAPKSWPRRALAAGDTGCLAEDRPRDWRSFTGVEMACGPPMNSLNVRGEIKSQATEIGSKMKKRSRITTKNQSPGHDRFARLVSRSTRLRNAGPGPGGDPQIISSGSNMVLRPLSEVYQTEACAKYKQATERKIPKQHLQTRKKERFWKRNTAQRGERERAEGKGNQRAGMHSFREGSCERGGMSAAMTTRCVGWRHRSRYGVHSKNVWGWRARNEATSSPASGVHSRRV
jgi:hypothetical protein